jgi:hypothetical protein
MPVPWPVAGLGGETINLGCTVLITDDEPEVFNHFHREAISC